MCPLCHEPLVAFELDGVEIDRCVDCGGVWLDAGELESLTGAFETGEEGAVASFFSDFYGKKTEAGG